MASSLAQTSAMRALKAPLGRGLRGCRGRPRKLQNAKDTTMRDERSSAIRPMGGFKDHMHALRSLPARVTTTDAPPTATVELRWRRGRPGAGHHRVRTTAVTANSEGGACTAST